jgi:hypothetical protein
MHELPFPQMMPLACGTIKSTYLKVHLNVCACEPGFTHVYSKYNDIIGGCCGTYEEMLGGDETSLYPYRIEMEMPRYMIRRIGTLLFTCTTNLGVRARV